MSRQKSGLLCARTRKYSNLNELFDKEKEIDGAVKMSCP